MDWQVQKTKGVQLMLSDLESERSERLMPLLVEQVQKLSHGHCCLQLCWAASCVFFPGVFLATFKFQFGQFAAFRLASTEGAALSHAEMDVLMLYWHHSVASLGTYPTTSDKSLSSPHGKWLEMVCWDMMRRGREMEMDSHPHDLSDQ